jgi:hypothetical protein
MTQDEVVVWLGIDWADQKHRWAMRIEGETRIQQGDLEHTPSRTFSRYPFMDIGRTISEFSPLRLAASKQFHRFSVNERQVLEIDGQPARLLF